MIRGLGLESARPVSTPGVKPAKEALEDVEELDKGEAHRYRAIAARLNYLAHDRLDLGYSTKEAARNMARPIASD